MVLSPSYLRPPRSPDDWIEISKGFENIWNMPNVLGAIDGKHIQIEAPANTGTLYHNYKGFFSIVLLAICDAKYCFTLVDIGQYGSNNDSGVLAKSEIGKRFEENKMNLPAPRKVNSCSYDPLPYYLVGDEIFPLKDWMMRPYPGKLTEEQSVFNYRHSRARRVIENAFGILRSRWRIFSRPIKATVENVEIYVWAAICLHNYLRLTDNAMNTHAGFVDCNSKSGQIKEGEWRSDQGPVEDCCWRNLKKVRGSRPNSKSTEMRDALKDYTNSEEGSVDWQLRYVRSTGDT